MSIVLIYLCIYYRFFVSSAWDPADLGESEISNKIDGKNTYVLLLINKSKYLLINFPAMALLFRYHQSC